MQFVVEPMRVEHIRTVAAIERLSFSQSWPMQAYRKELQQNRMAHYVVVRRTDALAFTAAELDLPQVAREREPSLIGRFAHLFRPVRVQPSVDADEELYQIVGYAGLWLMVDEAHITTIAVHPKYRGYGLGELALLTMIDRALEIGARWLTLEVRKSNHIAQALYQKYTFKEMGVRRRYYSDDGEDALVMWSDPIDSDGFSKLVAQNRASLESRLVPHA